ncbi:MAG: phage tail tip lysozyme [Clostridia bacterium]|nr:phage tail tip lysozyme [Clostridia bacterium]
MKKIFTLTICFALIFTSFTSVSWAKTPSTPDAREKMVYEFLTSKNGLALNKAAACGVMANMNAESANFVPGNVQTITGKTEEKYIKDLKSGAMKRSVFIDDGYGFGICQWTYGTDKGEKARLYDYAKDNGGLEKIDDLELQLAYLKEDLYYRVKRTLQDVPNTATGALIAAQVFCTGYLRPALQFTTDSTKRSNTAVTLYWERYSGKTIDYQNTNITGFGGIHYPIKLKLGDSALDVTGTVCSNHPLKSVKAKITNSSGEVLYSSTASTTSKTDKIADTQRCYSLGRMDSALKFSALEKTGTYTYSIEAKDTNGVNFKYSTKFTVSKSIKESTGSYATLANEKKLKDFSLPSTIEKDSDTVLGGKITSSVPLDTVNAKVINKTSGKTVKTVSVTPNTKTYYLSKLDLDLELAKMNSGTYRLVIEAQDKDGISELVNKTFKIDAKKISKAKSPSRIMQGETYSIAGIVSSDKKIKSVNVRILNASNKKAMHKEIVAVNDLSFHLSTLAEKFTFEKLKAGKFIYRVSATDGMGEKMLIDKEFVIDTKKLLNNNYPETIKKGKSFTIKGKVKSSFKLSKVQVKIVTKAGTTKYSKVAKPNAYSYNISKLDYYMKFSKLGKGTYYYRVYGTDKLGCVRLLNKEFVVK